jgi:hypothetical protein
MKIGQPDLLSCPELEEPAVLNHKIVAATSSLLVIVVDDIVGITLGAIFRNYLLQIFFHSFSPPFFRAAALISPERQCLDRCQQCQRCQQCFGRERNLILPILGPLTYGPKQRPVKDAYSHFLNTGQSSVTGDNKKEGQHQEGG